jgi:hypothetical protein
MSRARDRVAEHAAAVARSREVSSGVLDVLRDYLTRRRNRVLLRFSPAGGDIDVADLVAELLELRYGLLEAHAELLALRAERAPQADSRARSAADRGRGRRWERRQRSLNRDG